MAGKKGQKKRFWSDEEKVSICGQTCALDVSVAQVAPRYAMNANRIHKWLRDPRFAPDLEIVGKQVAETPCEKAVGIFVTAALPRRLRVTKIDVDLCGYGELSVPCHL